MAQSQMITLYKFTAVGMAALDSIARLTNQDSSNPKKIAGRGAHAGMPNPDTIQSQKIMTADSARHNAGSDKHNAEFTSPMEICVG